MDPSANQKCHLTLEEAKTRIEKIMLDLPKNATILEHKFYLAGVIDTLFEENEIDSEIREELYITYGPG